MTESIAPAPFTAIGQRTRLIEGDTKVTGRIRYVADLNIPGMAEARFVTSPHAHARIKAIDTSAATALPGVIAVVTAADLPNLPPTNRQRLLLARDRVIFVGQPVALVVAESNAIAEDAVELVDVTYEPLPAVVTLDAALADDAPLVWPTGKPGEAEDAAAHGAAVGGDEASDTKASNIASRGEFTRGDPATAFTQAAFVIEKTFRLSAVHQSPLEPHACAVQVDPYSDQVTVWSSTQGPFMVRQQVAEILGLSDSDVRCLAMPVGGGFGAKGVLYDPLIALAARLIGRPVRLVLSRYEEMVAANPTPEGRIHLKLAANADGQFTALESEIAFNSGCYPGSPVGIALLITGSMYNIPNVHVVGLDVLSFKQSVGAYRAPGIPQSMFALESIVDEMAATLQIDPLELRLQNAAKQGDPLINGNPWPKMGMSEVLRALQAHPVWQNRAVARAAGRGVGLAVGGWLGGTGPASAACQLERDGKLHVQIGSVDISGTNTGFALIAAEAFGVTPDQIKIVNGDTNIPAFALNAGGSKITYTVGHAIVEAVTEVRKQTLAIVADLLEVAAEDLEIADGHVQVKGSPSTRIALSDVAGRTMQFGGKIPPIIGHGRHAVTSQSPGFSAQLAEISVDQETGVVTIHNLVVAQDVGRALNPLVVEGQMMGGAMQGVGWGLYEGLVYDDYGQPLTASWMDYNVPNFTQAVESMETVIVEVPSDFGPYGAKGVGEPPVTPTAAAIGNAIKDAVGVRMTQLPMTAPRVRAAMTGTGQ
ncbi:MAG TPA: xanthine dehydrogenase family protein molybdopterin-binding subunit [Caldilineaceae bacterium]|nr:xanthine dehydrogenase family protein molybdopterin-binding subunit [Caldilineaceae bacterium]